MNRSFASFRIAIITNLLLSHTFLSANDCPKYIPLCVDDIVSILPIYPLHVTEKDSDCDGVPDTLEALWGTDPYRFDTDSDGTGDYADDYPLDPHKSVDTTPPAITLRGKQTVILYKYYLYKEAGAVARDDRDGTVAVHISGHVDTAHPGTYTLVYLAKDRKGNLATARRTVIVKNAFKPQPLRNSSVGKDDEGHSVVDVVALFIQAFLANDKDKVSHYVGENERLLDLLYDNADATAFLKRIYAHTYRIEEKAYKMGNASASIRFVDNGGHHQGGFELLLSMDQNGKKRWIITLLY